MADYTVTLPTVEVAPLLWALPLLPAAGAGVGAWLTRPGVEADERPVGQWAAAVGTWLALLAALAASGRVGGSSEGRALVAAGPDVLRLGSIDLHLGLTLDAVSALSALVLLAVASVGQLGLRLTRPGSARPGIEMGLLTGLGALGVLASCPLVALGAAGLAIGRLGAARTALPAAALLAAGAAVVSWGLSGEWGADSFVPGSQPHFAAITRDRRGSTSLTMVASPGALVSVDSAPVASAPFAHLPVAPGPHGFSVDPGPGADTSEIRKFRVAEGAEVAIVRLDGAQDTLGAATLLRAREDTKPVVARGRLGLGRRAGLAMSTWSGALLGLGLGLLLVPAARASQPAGRSLGALGAQTAALLVVGVLGARWLPLWSLGAGEAGAWLPWALLGGGLLLAVAGLGTAVPGRVVGFGAGASATLGLAAMAAGSPEAGLTQVAVVALAQALMLWGVALVEHHRPASDHDLFALQGLAPRVDAVRWLKLGYAALVGLAPVGLGALEALRALGAARGLVALPLGALTAVCLGRLVYRLSEGDEAAPRAPRNVRRHDADDEGEPRGEEPGAPLPVAPAAILAAAVVLLGPLAASTLYRSPLGEWLGAAPLVRDVETSASVWTFLMFIGLTAAALGGARWARGQHGAGRPAATAGEPEGDEAVLGGAAGRAAGAVIAAGAAVGRVGTSVAALVGADRAGGGS